MPPVTSTSPVTNSVTVSENVKVAVSPAVERIFSGKPVMVTDGAESSHIPVNETSLVGPLFTPSDAEDSTTTTTTSAFPDGVMTSE